MNTVVLQNQPRFRYWWMQPLVLGVMNLGITVVSIYLKQIGVAIVWFMISVLVIGFIIWRTTQVAERLSFSDEAIEVWNYRGKHICLHWNQIAELYQFDYKSIPPLKVIRLVSSDKKEQMIFTDLLKGYGELMDHIRAKIPHLRIHEKPTVWERIIRWL